MSSNTSFFAYLSKEVYSHSRQPLKTQIIGRATKTEPIVQ